MAFTNPYAVQRGALAIGAIAAVVMHETIFGLLDAIRAGRIAREEEAAYGAWDHALSSARHDAGQMSALAKASIEAALDAQDEAAELRAEIARLRRAVDQRDAVIRSLG